MIIVALAFIVGFLYLLWIRRKDQFEKEPFGRLLIAFLFGGTLSVIFSLTIYSYIPTEHNFIDSILKIGPIEEISKLLALAACYRFFKKDFNEPTDGLVYMSSVALGFSTIENIFYSFGSSYPYSLLALRSVICVLGHMSFSGYMGIAYYIHKKSSSNWSGLIVSFIVASVAHGLYDGFIFETNSNLLIYGFWVISVLFFIAFFNMTLSLSPFKKRFHTDEFKEINNVVSFQCINCNTDIKSNRLTFQKVEFSICESCDQVLVSRDHVFKLFTYYRPGFRKRRFINSLPEDDQIAFLDDNGNIHYHSQYQLLSARQDHLEVWLNNFGKKGVLERIETKISGKIFKWIGADKLLNLPT